MRWRNPLIRHEDSSPRALPLKKDAPARNSRPYPVLTPSHRGRRAAGRSARRDGGGARGRASQARTREAPGPARRHHDRPQVSCIRDGRCEGENPSRRGDGQWGEKPFCPRRALTGGTRLRRAPPRSLSAAPPPKTAAHGAPLGALSAPAGPRPGCADRRPMLPRRRERQAPSPRRGTRNHPTPTPPLRARRKRRYALGPQSAPASSRWRRRGHSALIGIPYRRHVRHQNTRRLVNYPPTNQAFLPKRSPAARKF